MTPSIPLYPFDPARRIGTVIEVGAAGAKANMPDAALASGRWLHGARAPCGEVGEFAFIEVGELALLARVVEVRLPERDRLSVEAELGKELDVHPVGTLEFLASICVRDGSVSSGVTAHPRLAAAVYSAHPALLKWIAESAVQASAVALDLAVLRSTPGTVVSFTPEKLFGRHCAILGATGGGKSWTLARVIEQSAKFGSKVVLVDATGEFHTLRGEGIRHAQIGAGDPAPTGCVEVCVPYSEMTEADLFALFKPSGQAQGPKMRQAMRTLKLLRLEPELAPGKTVYAKAGQSRATFAAAYHRHAKAVEAPQADFNIEALAQQILQECVFPTDNNKPGFFGRIQENEQGYCLTLVSRIEDMMNTSALACVLRPGDKPTMSSVLESFLGDEGARVLRLSLKYLPFENDARSVVMNAVGRRLLELARLGKFRERPLLVAVDEAHQFLNRHVGDENSKYPLDSFELIAKEGRKYWLTVCFATQRPRDIPEGVLSQVGTMIVHRLTNERDRELVEKASGDLDRGAAAFLPTLGPGQAVIVGVDLAMPMMLRILPPCARPDSRGPDYQGSWAGEQG